MEIKKSPLNKPQRRYIKKISLKNILVDDNMNFYILTYATSPYCFISIDFSCVGSVLMHLAIS